MNIILDDLILTKDLPSTGGSKMLEGYMSLFNAEVVDKISASGKHIVGKAAVGEFASDLLGETNYQGPSLDAEGNLAGAANLAIAAGTANAALGFDVNGSPRRAAAVAGQVCIKPTYGVVSRFGTIALACSGECVSVSAATAADCQALLDIVAGHDDKDGTSLPQEQCLRVTSAKPAAPIKRVAVGSCFFENVDSSVKAAAEAARAKLQAAGVECVEIDAQLLAAAKPAWNILMAAELCNNVSRFDGVKYGYRAKGYESIDELYTKSRSEAFGDVLKTLILFGSDVLFTQNYFDEYDRAMRIRRLICQRFQEIFVDFDAVLIPSCSKLSFSPADIAADKFIAFQENLYSAPASISGLPAVVAGGVQLLGPAFSDNALLAAAAVFEGKEA